MRILVIDQCSSSKRVPEWFEPYTEEEVDAHSLQELLNGIGSRTRVPSLRAERLYQGRQQSYVSDACDQLRKAGDEVDRVFISAGFGVVNEGTELPPYDITFNDRSTTQVRTRGAELGIGDDLQAILNAGDPYDLVFFALGKSYLDSFPVGEILTSVTGKTSIVLFNQESTAKEYQHVRSISARLDEAKELGEIVVAVKGRLLQNFAAHRIREATPETLSDIVDYCRSPATSQSTMEG